MAVMIMIVGLGLKLKAFRPYINANTILPYGRVNPNSNLVLNPNPNPT
jgi:hypothetical protein